MDDIVQRLRDKAFAHPPPDRGPRIEDEAADEIERLRKLLDIALPRGGFERRAEKWLRETR